MSQSVTLNFVPFSNKKLYVYRDSVQNDIRITNVRQRTSDLILLGMEMAGLAEKLIYLVFSAYTNHSPQTPHMLLKQLSGEELYGVFTRDGDRKPVQTGLSMSVYQSKTGPPSKRFGFLCMHRVPGGVIKLSAVLATTSLASQCLPSATIKHSTNSHFKISQVWYPAHFHYAQKPSERRESAQGASIQELSRTFQFRQVQPRIPLCSFVSKKCH